MYLHSYMNCVCMMHIHTCVKDTHTRIITNVTQDVGSILIWNKSKTLYSHSTGQPLLFHSDEFITLMAKELTLSLEVFPLLFLGV